jgi:hypothetical protein
LSNKQFPVAEKIFAPADESPELKEKITELRNEGNVVIQQLPDVVADAKAMGCTQSLCLVDGQWLVKD